LERRPQIRRRGGEGDTELAGRVDARFRQIVLERAA
jgi:hypothetical protein